jgi:hypothetical protein
MDDGDEEGDDGCFKCDVVVVLMVRDAVLGGAGLGKGVWDESHTVAADDAAAAAAEGELVVVAVTVVELVMVDFKGSFDE